jgi:hypothetical protein
VIGFHRRIGATYAPAKEGAFEYIDYSECAAVYETVFADGQATGPALRQDGKVYFYYLSTGPSGAWYNQKCYQHLGHKLLPGQQCQRQHNGTIRNNTRISRPMEDRSSSAFGAANFTCPGCPGYTVSAGIDQWSLALQSAVVARDSLQRSRVQRG